MHICDNVFVKSIFWMCLFSILLFGDAEAALQCYDCHGTRSTLDLRPEDATHRNISSGGFRGNHRQHLGEGSTPCHVPCVTREVPPIPPVIAMDISKFPARLTPRQP